LVSQENRFFRKSVPYFLQCILLQNEYFSFEQVYEYTDQSPKLNDILFMKNIVQDFANTSVPESPKIETTNLPQEHAITRASSALKQKRTSYKSGN
jgi:hypothetical protein